MKQTRLCLFPLLLICGVCVVFAEEAADSAEGLIRMIYRDHRPARAISMLAKRETLDRYFDREMTALFIKDQECSRRTGEVCNLDYDPIFNSQEIADVEPKLTVKRLSASSGTEVLKVGFDNNGPVTLIYHLTRGDAGWRVSDIVDAEGHSLKGLLSQPLPSP